MKRLYYIAASLLILAGVASCEKKTNVQEPDQQQSGKMIPFSVTAGQGAKKTSMVSGVLSWTKGDQITVLTQAGEYSTTLTLKGNGGSATGEFSGEIDDAVADKTELYGLYNATYNSGNFTVSVPAEQTYNATSFQEGIFPSIGTGTYQKNGNTSITFQNPMGIIRLKLKGSAGVKSVKITAASSNIAGAFTVTPALAVSGGTGKAVTITCSETVTLTSDGVYFNFVTAPFASQTVTVEVTKSDDTTYSEDITIAVTASSASKQEIEVGGGSSDTCDGITKISSTSVTDLCGNTYQTVQIGTQIWMAENFKCNQYSSNLPSAQYDATIIGQTIPAMTSEGSYTPLYKDATASGYGYFYNWAAAVGIPDAEDYSTPFTAVRQGICPDGWHVPTNGEFATLRDYIEVTKGKGEDKAGKYLKSETGWNEAGNGLDCFGFNGIPVGQGDGTPHIGDRLRMYTATIVGNARLEYDTDEMEIKDSAKGNEMYSVRCLKD